MAPVKENLYELIGVSMTATSGEIATAYRKKSLKVHPDRNPDNPEAANLFHLLFEAHELLKDVQKRAAYDLELNAATKKAERFKSLDNKRKAAMEDLEEQELAYKRMREDGESAEQKKQQDINRLKEESRLLRVAREAQQTEAMLKMRAQTTREIPQDSNSIPFNPLEATLKLKWPTTLNATYLSSAEALKTHLSQFSHQIDTLLYSPKPAKKSQTAMVAFKTLSAAIQCYQLSEKAKLLVGVDLTWATGQPPEVLRAKSVPREASPAPVKQPQHNEGDILAKMKARQAERDRLADEIRKREAEEE